MVHISTRLSGFIAIGDDQVIVTSSISRAVISGDVTESQVVLHSGEIEYVQFGKTPLFSFVQPKLGQGNWRLLFKLKDKKKFMLGSLPIYSHFIEVRSSDRESIEPRSWLRNLLK